MVMDASQAPDFEALSDGSAFASFSVLDTLPIDVLVAGTDFLVPEPCRI